MENSTCAHKEDALAQVIMAFAMSNPSPNAYRLRAECSHDIEEFLSIAAANEMSLTVVDYQKHPDFPDCELAFLTTSTLAEVRKILRKVPDGHVMVQTVAKYAEYTGDRNFEL